MCLSSVSPLSHLGQSSATKHVIFFGALNLKLPEGLTLQDGKRFSKNGTEELVSLGGPRSLIPVLSLEPPEV